MKTPNGVNVGLDYVAAVQDKCIRLVHDGTGKIKRHGNKGKIELTSFCRIGKQYEYVWICMDMYEYQWIFMNIH